MGLLTLRVGSLLVTMTDILCYQHNFSNGLYGYQFYCSHMSTESINVPKCERTHTETPNQRNELPETVGFKTKFILSESEREIASK